MTDDEETYTVTMRSGLTEVGNAYLAHALLAQAERYKHAAWLGPVEDAPEGGLVRFEFRLRGDRPYAIVSSPAQDAKWQRNAREMGLPLRVVLKEVARNGIDVRGLDAEIFMFCYSQRETNGD